MSKGIVFTPMNGSGLKIGIIVSRWNSSITDSLLDGCMRALVESKIKKQNIEILAVTGAYELVYAAKRMTIKEKFDAVICLGSVIKGETPHFDFICNAVSMGIMNLNLEGRIPVIFGVLTCLNEKQAIDRSTGNNNHGYFWGKTGVEMALLKKKR